MIILSLEESNNFDNYLKELGVGFILRQLAQVVFIFIHSFFLDLFWLAQVAQPTVTVGRL